MKVHFWDRMEENGRKTAEGLCLGAKEQWSDKKKGRAKGGIIKRGKGVIKEDGDRLINKEDKILKLRIKIKKIWRVSNGL